MVAVTLAASRDKLTSMSDNQKPKPKPKPAERIATLEAEVAQLKKQLNHEEERHELYNGPALDGKTWWPKPGQPKLCIPDPHGRRTAGDGRKFTVRIETDGGDAFWARIASTRSIRWLARGPVTRVVAVVTYGP